LTKCWLTIEKIRQWRRELASTITINLLIKEIPSMKKVICLSITLFLLATLSLSACGGDSGGQRLPQDSDAGSDQTQASSGDPAAGQKLFTSTCSACHGPAGEGLPGLGKDMTTSEFIASNTDDELVDFIKVGRDPSDPLNTTGVAMPPKAGNPALSDEDLYNVVSYIRTIQKK
jgi:mono/diheme cytochrome c family protein